MAHLKEFFQKTLLLAAGIDANGQYTIHARAVVESENKDAWEYFLQHLKLAMPQILEASLMSDRDKGLQSAEDVLRPNVTRLFCLQHLKRNFQVKFGEKLVGYFWGIANSTAEQNFHHTVTSQKYS